MNQLPAIYAHRGARLVAPENTLPAFAAALEMAADGVELDVHRSADGQLVVIHDFTLGHTTNGAGLVTSHTAAELAGLDAGSHLHPSFRAVGVPTLGQVFDLVGKRCRVNVEIKSESPTGGDAVELLVEMIRQRDIYDHVIVSSFNPITLIKLRWLEPKIALGLLYEKALPAFLQHAWFTPILRPNALHPHHSLVDQDLMNWARQHGCAVNVWTVNDQVEARRLAELGVDAIITDAPDKIRAGLMG